MIRWATKRFNKNKMIQVHYGMDEGAFFIYGIIIKKNDFISDGINSATERYCTKKEIIRFFPELATLTKFDHFRPNDPSFANLIHLFMEFFAKEKISKDVSKWIKRKIALLNKKFNDTIKKLKS